MKIITGGRRIGKTFRLIEESAKTGAYIICHSKEECSRIFADAQKHDLNIPFPISYHEFLNKQYYGKGIKGFLIDDIERLLWMLSSVPIDMITIPAESIEKIMISHGQTYTRKRTIQIP